MLTIGCDKTAPSCLMAAGEIGSMETGAVLEEAIEYRRAIDRFGALRQSRIRA